MKRMALIVMCSVCISTYAQSPVEVSLTIDDHGDIRPVTPDLYLNVTGTAPLDYVKVYSTDKFAAVKLGYDENAIYKESLDLKKAGVQYLEMTLKDLGGATDWNQMKVSLNDLYPDRKAVIGNYLADAEYLSDGWFRIKIPISDLQPMGVVSHITFPHAYNANIGVKEITLTGTNAPFQWFGSEKFDNARKDNQPGQSTLIFKNDGIVVDQMKLFILNEASSLTQTSMPYSAFQPTLLQGENLLLGMVTDKNGLSYYSDTIKFILPAGLSYQVHQVSCFGASDGAIDVQIDGGIPPYNYSWSNGAISEDIAGLTSGVYTVLVMDSLGKGTSATISVEQPNALSAALVQDHCYTSQAFLQVAGGMGPYEYNIDGGDYSFMGEGVPGDIVEIPIQITGDTDPWYGNNIASLQVDGADNMYFSGIYAGKLDIGVGSKTGSVGGEGKEGNYLVCTGSNGDFKWGFYTIDQNPTPYHDNTVPLDLAVDDEGNSTLIIDVNRNITIITPDNIELSLGSHIVHLDADGKLQWIKHLNRGISNVSVDKEGNIYAIGTQPAVISGTGTTDLALIKFDRDGTELWRKMITGRQSEQNRDMYINNNNEILIIGDYTVDMNFDGIILNTSGLRDAYVAKLNSNGQVLWARSGGSPNGDDDAFAITDDNKGNVFATLSFTAKNGKYGDMTFSHDAQVLFRLNSQDGSPIWGRPYFTAGFLEPYDAYALSVLDDMIYLTAQGFQLILKPGEDFDPQLDHNLLFGFDYNSNLKSLRYLSTYNYDRFFKTPTDVTKDNHLVFANYFGGLAVKKYGAPMQQLVSELQDHEYISVKDANNCTSLLDDLTIEDLPPLPPSICYITAEGEGNKLFFTDSGQGEESAGYNVYRETFAMGEYELIGSAGEGTFEFLDSSANTMERSYQYAVTAIDGCGNESDFSDPHRTMHLTVNDGNLGQINLIWDGYQGFDYNSFKIYRGSSPNNMELLTSLPAYLYTYTDLDPSPFTMYYQISIENDGSCSANSQSLSGGRLAEEYATREVTSNIAADYGVAGNLTFYPNPGHERIEVRFSPDGDEYKMKVFDASGRVVSQVDGIFDRAVIERGQLPAGIYNVILSKNSGKPLHGRIAFK